MSGLVALFQTAQQHLKWPKVRLALVDGSPLVLSLCGPGSKTPGHINVTDGGPYGDNVWYGRVSPDGRYDPSRRADADTASEIAALLKYVSAHPAAAASEYGRLTGNCCFCRRGLEDERSTSVGYGPVCAGHFGLPWGSS